MLHCFSLQDIPRTGNRQVLSICIETQKARYFVLKLAIDGKGKAEFKNINLQKIALEFE